MPYEFTLTAIMPASAQEVYDAWLDSLAHSQMTGGKAEMSDEIDADVTAWNGYITGRNLHLVPHEHIVQSWRTSKFTEEHEDSVVTLSLEETEEGTLLTLVHSNVPDGQTSYEWGGWESNYFKPMRAYFAKRRAPARKRASAKTKPAPKAGKSTAAPKTGKRTSTKPAQNKPKPSAKAKARVGPKASRASSKPPR